MCVDVSYFSISSANAHRVLGKHKKHIDQLEFIEGGEGLYFSLSWGDWDEGMIVKIEAGLTFPRHSHTHDYHGMTTQGN